jgi:sugar lactone lactonase YvrE
MQTRIKRLATIAVTACLVGAPAGFGAATATAGKTAATPNPFTIVAQWSAKSLGLRYPKNLALAPSGNMYVTDYGQHVTEISPAGKVLRRWGKLGSGPGQFHFIAGDPSAPRDVQASIAVGPDGKVYVSDSGNARVQVFTGTGRFVRQFGTYGPGKAQFLSVFDLVVDRGGNVYVTDDQTRSIRKFSPSGNVVWTIDGRKGDPDLVGHHHYSVIDAHGRIPIANDDKSRISFVDLAGHKVDAFGGRAEFLASACDATVDAAGNTYVNGCYAPAGSEVFDSGHNLVGQWRGSPLAHSPRFARNGAAYDLTWDGAVVKLRIAHSAR